MTRLKRMSLFLAALSVSLAWPQSGWTQSATPQHGPPGVERLYVLYCGDIALTDASSFTPGASGPGALSDTCYLIKHQQDWLLWDTGLPDSLATMPDGMKSNAGVWTSKKTLASQLAELDLKPSDIRYLALSHSHPDHVGNLNLFRTLFGTEHFPRNLAAVVELKRLAAKYDKTLPQFALRWTSSNPVVGTALVGFREPAEVTENLGALGWTISADDMAEIDAILARHGCVTEPPGWLED